MSQVTAEASVSAAEAEATTTTKEGNAPVNDLDVIEALCAFSQATTTAPPLTQAESQPTSATLPRPVVALFPPLKIQCDPPSSKARFKCYSTLVRLCSRYGRSPTEDHISVCEGRKTVHVLNDGEVDHLACFIGNETPGASFRVRKLVVATADVNTVATSKSEMQSSYLRSIVVPNGWKVAVVDEGHLFTAEARVMTSNNSAAGEMEYRFVSVNELGEEENPAEWYTNLCEAFRRVSQPLEDKKQTKTHRYNGKLLLGLHYHNPQLKVQDFVRKQFAQGWFDAPQRVHLRARVEEWLMNCEQERLRANAAADTTGVFKRAKLQ